LVDDELVMLDTDIVVKFAHDADTGTVDRQCDNLEAIGSKLGLQTI
jgi:hypothetical protein